MVSNITNKLWMRHYEQDFLDKVVLQDGEDFYFWDETWGNKIGPYSSYIDVLTALDLYCKTELGEKGL